MLSYYRQSFIKLATLINKLDPESSDAAAVCYEIQCELIPRIQRVEKRIRHWKKLQPQTDETRDKAKVYQRISKTLRYFGDAIAFTYIDRWDIKPMSRGNTPGFISGKSGFRLEKQMLKAFCEKGTPTLLADLTNCLRHGDAFCFLPNRSPIIFEAKGKGSGRSGRAHRQKKRLKKLTEYLDTDETEFLGAPMYRVSPPSELVDYPDVMSEVAQKAYQHGAASKKVGDALVYMAMREFDEDMLKKAGESFSKPHFALITSAQYYEANYPYYPITLVIKDPKTLAEFLSANMVLAVSLDFAKLEECIESRDSKVKMLKPTQEEPWALELAIPKLDFMKVSQRMYGRLFLEFMDVDWFAESILTIPKERLLEAERVEAGTEQ